MTRKILSFMGITACLFVAQKASAQQPTTTFVLTQAPCNNNGILTANFTNITPPLNVEWHLYNGTTITHSGVTTTSDALTGYSGVALYVTASSATTATDGYYQGAMPFHYTVSTPPVLCPALGTATATPTGGTAPYSYQWYNPSTSTVVSTTNPATNLPPGQYGILITDANGCTAGSYNNAIDSIFIYSTPSFDYSVTTTTANCTNGSATAGSFTGSGVPPYTYQWSNGANSAAITGLTFGYYSITVTDAQGCQRTRGEEVHQAVNIGVNAVATPATCLQNDGSIITFGSGGVSPYSYAYSNGVNTQTNPGLSAGGYSVTVTDANGCIGQSQAYVNASTPITATYTTTPSSCTSATGTATLNITGGQAPYTVTWSTYPVQTGTNVTGLAAGNYSFHITDANGCVRTGIVPVPPQSVVAVSVLGNNATCTQSNGSLSATATGGNAPYAYQWSTGATSSSITGLPSGSYSVNVTDNNGCHTMVYHAVEVSSPVNVGVTSTPASCIYTNDGSLSTTVWGGTAPYTYLWSNGQTASSISGLGQGGPYYVTVTDANGCSRGAQSYVSYNPAGTSCYCTISGKVYNDANHNCTLDAGETGINNIAVNCSGFGTAYTNASGEYSFKVPSGTYTLSQNVLATYPLAACQSNSISVTTVAASGCTQTVNFADTATPLHDIHISLWQQNGAIPGFGHQQSCIISNQGTVTESSILAGYKNDGQIGSATFSPSGIFANAGTNYYSTSGNTVPSLTAGSAAAFTTSYTVPANIPLNTALVFQDSAVYSGPMSTWVNDYSPWNNVNYVTENVVGAWDPNFMQVNTQGEGAEGYITRNDSTLNYMVHFQNEGNYYAQNVVVVDSLSDKLDWTSLRPIYSSHNAAITIDENGVLKYTFKNIHLPAKSMNEDASNGMFVYSIKLKPNLPYGTQIKNNAGIIFDFNEPVITNGVLNTLKSPTSVHNVNSNGLAFGIYPNPTQQGFTAVIDNTVSNATTVINITDISGRTILTKELKLATGKQLVPMSTDGLRDGIYFVNINVAGKKGTQKLVIVK